MLKNKMLKKASPNPITIRKTSSILTYTYLDYNLKYPKLKLYIIIVEFGL